MIWRDDEDYEELQDYVKDNYYVIGKTADGKFIRIPKGRAVAVIQKIVSNVNDFVKDGKINSDEVGKVFWKDLKEDLDIAVSNLAPNNPLENNLIAPISQAISNKTWYGEDLVPSRLQDKPKEEQYDETTDSISKWIGQALKISPYKVNYLLDQYSGGVGDVILPMLTPQAENNVLEDKFTSDATMKNKYPGQFFEKADELKVNNNSEKATDLDKLKYKYISNVQSEVSDLYKQKREIQNSNKSDGEKKEELKKVQKQINEKTKEALNNVDDIKISNNTAKVGDNQYYKYKDSWTKLTDEEKDKNKSISLEAYSKYKNATQGMDKSQDKINALINQNISDSEKKAIYENYVGSQDSTYDLIKNTGIDIDAYLKYKSNVTDNKKDTTMNYLNSAKGLTQEQKLLLAGFKYTLSNSEQSQLAQYINNMKLSKKEKLEIYGKLKGFKVYDNGRVTW